MGKKVALITGGNGITGSALLEHLVNYTTAEQWSKIIVTSRSPFRTHVQDPRIEFILLDFTQDSEELAKAMSATCESVTHAYFASYIHKDDFDELNQANNLIFENFLHAVTKASSALENITLQTGGKYYNLHMSAAPWPVREEDEPQKIPFDNFYFPQQAALIQAQKGSKWTYNVVRPVAIIGCTEKANGMNSALTFALYFSICAKLGSHAPMPTNRLYWEGCDDVSYAPLFADLTIYVSTQPQCANEAFNCTNTDHFNWQYLWPKLAEYFGAHATTRQPFKKARPEIGELQQEFTFTEWSAGKKDVWNELCDEAGLPGAKQSFDFATWGYQDWVFQRTWSATLSMDKARRYGWTGYADTHRCFLDTWRMMERLGLIPPPRKVGMVNGGQNGK